MAKKTFNLENPAMQFISTPEEAIAEPIEIVDAIAPAPEGYKVNPLYIEKRSKRLQLLIQPTLLEKLKARAKQEEKSVNDFIHNLLEDVLRGE